MKKKTVQKGLLSIVLAQTVLTTGCSLLPEEKEVMKVVTIQDETVEKYELAQVIKTQVALTKSIHCTYSQLKEENLSFSTEGRKVKYIYVDTGDRVKAGDILAKLDVADLEEDIADLEYSIEKNEMLLRHTEELKAFELQEAKKEYQAGRMDAASYAARKEQIEDSYRGTIQNYEDTLYIAGLRLERYQEELAGSILYAGMDGTVSYIRSELEGSRIAAGTTAITIIDSSKCAFRTTNMDDAQYFTAGDRVSMFNSNGTEYKTTLLSEEEAPDAEHLYFALEELDFELSVGTRATITLTLDERQDVLALPKNAVHHAGDLYYVYVEDENGLKSIRYITVGLAGDSLYEITGGLAEGDIVIKR